MALEKAVISIPFVGGLDTKTDKKLVEAGALTDAKDGIYTKAKTVIKRNGYDAMPTAIMTGGNIADANRLAEYKDELPQFTDEKLYSFSETSQKWIDKGITSHITVKSKLFTEVQQLNINQQNICDESMVNGVKVIAWTTPSSVFATVIDEDNDVQYLSSFKLYDFVSVTFPPMKTVVIDDFIFVFYQDNGTLRYRKIDTLNPIAFGADTVLVAANVDGLAFGLLDAVEYGVNAVVSWHNNASNDIEVRIVNSAGAILDSASLTNFSGPNTTLDIKICIDSSNSNIYISVIGGAVPTISDSTLQYTVLDSTLTQILPFTVIDPAAFVLNSKILIKVSTIIQSPNTMRVFWDYLNVHTPASLNDYQINTATATLLGVVTTDFDIVREIELVSRPFIENGKVYVLTKTKSQLQGTYFLIDIDGNLLGKANTERSNPGAYRVVNVVNPAAGDYLITGIISVRLVNDNILDFNVTNVAEMEFNFLDLKAQRSKEVNNVLLIAGSYPQLYDGSVITEIFFNAFPENISVVVNAPTAGLGVGNYAYYVTYEWTDARGNIYRSAPSTGTIVAIGVANETVTLSIPTLRLTNKDNVAIVVYRTEANGTIPYRLNFNVTTAFSNPIANNKAVDFITFTDSNADSTIIANEILYTTGGVLDNIVPPSFNHIEIYKNRVILSDLEDSKDFWYSKLILPGEGVSFNDAFFERVDTLGEAVNATKSLDDKLIIFKDSLLFAMNGDGPLDTGAQNNFTDPQLISSDVGCIEADSITLIPNGLLFKSFKGVYLLDRALGLSYIGAPVEDYNSQVITSGKLLENVNQVRFLTNSGRTLLYDYLFNKWNTFTNHQGLDSVIYNGVYCYLRTNNEVYMENSTSFTDDGTAIVLNPVGAWIKISSLQGFQRVRRAALLGNYYSAHTLTVKVYYDYNETVFDSYAFNTATGLVGPDNVYQFRIHLKRQKCEAIKFELDDSIAAIPGQGYSINDLALELGIKKGIDKLPAIKSVG